MAEIAIPLAALGVMYIVSNQKTRKQSKRSIFKYAQKK